MNLSPCARVRPSGLLMPGVAFGAAPLAPPLLSSPSGPAGVAPLAPGPAPPVPTSLGAPAPLPPRMASVVDTIAGSLVRHAAPLVQADPGFQTRVASAAGSAAAAHLSPYAAVATAAVVLASGVVVWRALR